MLEGVAIWDTVGTPAPLIIEIIHLFRLTVSRVMGRAAPHSRGPVASRKRDNRTSAPVGAPPTPHSGDGRERKATTRAQQRAAGTNNTALFDIVRWEDAQSRHCVRLVRNS